MVPGLTQLHAVRGGIAGSPGSLSPLIRSPLLRSPLEVIQRARQAGELAGAKGRGERRHEDPGTRCGEPLNGRSPQCWSGRALVADDAAFIGHLAVMAYEIANTARELISLARHEWDGQFFPGEVRFWKVEKGFDGVGVIAELRGRVCSLGSQTLKARF